MDRIRHDRKTHSASRIDAPDPIGPGSSARLGISVAATPETPTQIAAQPHRASSDYEDFKDGITAQMSELRRSQQDVLAQLRALTQSLSDSVRASTQTDSVRVSTQPSAASAASGNTNEVKDMTATQRDRLARVASTTSATNARLLGATDEQLRAIDSAIGTQTQTQVSSTARNAEAAGVLATLVGAINSTGQSAQKRLTELAHAKNFGDLLARIIDEVADRPSDRLFRAFIKGHVKILNGLNGRPGSGFHVVKAYHYAIQDEKEEAERSGDVSIFYQTNAGGHAHLLQQALDKISPHHGGRGKGRKGRGGGQAAGAGAAVGTTRGLVSRRRQRRRRSRWRLRLSRSVGLGLRARPPRSSRPSSRRLHERHQGLFADRRRQQPLQRRPRLSQPTSRTGQLLLPDLLPPVLSCNLG